MAEFINPNEFTGFPDELAPPEKKVKKDWLLQHARAAYYAANALPDGAIGYKSRLDYKRYREYAQGRQEVENYKKLSGINDPVLISRKRIQPLAPKYRQIGIALASKRAFKTRISAIDPQAPDTLARKQADRKARLMLRETLAQSGMPELTRFPTVAAQPGEPDDLEGMDLMAEYERLPICADAQDAIRAIYNANNFEALRMQWIADLFDYGFAATKDDTDADGVKIRNCRADKMIIPFVEDFSDLPYCGEIRTIHISALAAMSSGQIKEEELKGLYSKSGLSEWYTAGDYTSVGDWYARATCQVLDLEILSTDLRKSYEWKDKRGNPKYQDAKGERKKDWKQEKETKFQNVYRVKWIVGTDICFDYGKQVNIKRDNKNEAKARLSYHVVSADIHDMVAYSRMAAIIDLIDDIAVLKIKLRNALYSVIPSGWDVNLDALEDVDLGNGKGKLTPFDNLSNFARKGIIVSRSRAINGQIRSEKPAVSFLQGGIGNEVAAFGNQILANKQEINEILGYNPVTDASAPNPKTPNPVTEAMRDGTNNALNDLFFACKQMEQALAASVLIRAQDMLRPDVNGKTRASELQAIIGIDSARRLASAPPLDKYHFGVVVEDEPSAEEVADFNNALDIAMQAGQINIDQRLMAKMIAKDNLLQAQLYLSYWVRKNMEKSQKDAIQMQQTNARVQQESSTVAADQEIRVIDAKLQADLRRYDRQNEHKLGQIREAGSIDLEEERIGSTGRIGAAQEQAKAKDSTNYRDNQTRLIQLDKSERTQELNAPNLFAEQVTPLTNEDNPLPKPAFSFLQPPEINDQMEEPMEDVILDDQPQ